MKTSVLELVDVILRRLQDRPDAAPTEKGLRLWLRRLGYAQGDIEAAMKLVGPRVLSYPATLERRPGAIRHFSTYEEFKMTPEARDMLQRLDFYELIAPHEREMLLERIEQIDGEVGLEELDYLLSWLIFSIRDVMTQQTTFEVMRKDDALLH